MNWIGSTLVSPGPPGVYGERVLQGQRVWDPYRSKLAALYHLGHGVELDSGMRVLYLGAAHGTTVSHVADYVEVVYAVDVAPRPMKNLLDTCRTRKNIIPLLADAAHPDEYLPYVEQVDIVYQDVAQRDQDAIAVENRRFMREGGRYILMLKTRSVDVRRSPRDVCTDTLSRLASCFRILTTTWLLPYHRDHVAIICEGLK